eukprot:g66300.t1
MGQTLANQLADVPGTRYYQVKAWSGPQTNVLYESKIYDDFAEARLDKQRWHSQHPEAKDIGIWQLTDPDDD